MQGILILGLIFAIIIAIFSIQNAVAVSLSFFTWEFEMSLVVVILGSLAMGTLMMGLFSVVKQYRLKKSLKKLQLKNKRLLKEKENIKEELAQIKNNKTEHKEQYLLNKEKENEFDRTDKADNSNNDDQQKEL